MVNFENISLKQISTLFDILVQNSLFDTDFVKKQYLRSGRHFKETINFLEGLNLITLFDGEIIIDKRYRHIFDSAQVNREKLKDLLIQKLIYKENIFAKYVQEFLLLFHFKNGKYVSLQHMNQRLKYSGLRNFLIDLGFL